MFGDGNGFSTPTPTSLSDLVPHIRSLLRSCARGRAPPSFGHALHSLLLKSGHLFLSPISSNVSAALFHFYAALGPPASALRAFDAVPPSSRSAADWTALVSSQSPADALRLFRSMLRARVSPDAVALLALLSAAARLADPSAGAAAHLLHIKLGIPFPTNACNAAVDMYAKCGRMDDARRLLGEMPEPNVVSYTAVLSGALRWEGLDSGREFFERMPQRNEVSWTVMIAASVEAGSPKKSLSLLALMLFGDKPARNLNHISLCSLLSACSQAGDLTVGRWIHTHFTKAVLSDEEHVLRVGTALVDMYSKCGRIGAACRVFETMPCRNLVAWNAMLSGVSMHGMGDEALRLFFRMISDEQQHPDDITIVSILSACSRSGLVEEGRKIFRDLSSVYGLEPKVEHYACMVDLLGRAGLLEEAEVMVREMRVRPSEVVLGSLLASCSLHGNLELGRCLMRELVEMDPHNTEYHVLLSNLYTSSGRYVEADGLRQTMKDRGIRKAPGISSIEINGDVHRFVAGDKSHPQTQEVYAMLDEVVKRLRSMGFVPDVASQISRIPDNYLENDNEQEERELSLLVHSERLAICFGLISTKPGMPLRIFKNLRICSDCHSAIKLISSIYEREIIIRDRNRFHCFKQGTCSCSGYW